MCGGQHQVFQAMLKPGDFKIFFRGTHSHKHVCEHDTSPCYNVTAIWIETMRHWESLVAMSIGIDLAINIHIYHWFIYHTIDLHTYIYHWFILLYTVDLYKFYIIIVIIFWLHLSFWCDTVYWWDSQVLTMLLLRRPNGNTYCIKCLFQIVINQLCERI